MTAYSTVQYTVATPTCIKVTPWDDINYGIVFEMKPTNPDLIIFNIFWKKCINIYNKPNKH